VVLPQQVLLLLLLLELLLTHLQVVNFHKWLLPLPLLLLLSPPPPQLLLLLLPPPLLLLLLQQKQQQQQQQLSQGTLHCWIGGPLDICCTCLQRDVQESLVPPGLPLLLLEMHSVCVTRLQDV
jgi:hypothetical protein